MRKALRPAGDATTNNPVPDLQSPEHREVKKPPTRKKQMKRAAESGVTGSDVYEEDEDMTDTMTKASLASAVNVEKNPLKKPKWKPLGTEEEMNTTKARKSDDEMLAERIEKGGFLNEQSRFDAPVLDRAAWKGKVFNLVGEAVAKAEAAIIADRAPRCDAHRFDGSGGAQNSPLNMVCTCDAPVRKGAIAERAASYLAKQDVESLRVARELGIPMDAAWINGVLDGGDDLEG